VPHCIEATLYYKGLHSELQRGYLWVQDLRTPWHRGHVRGLHISHMQGLHGGHIGGIAYVKNILAQMKCGWSGWNMAEISSAAFYPHAAEPTASTALHPHICKRNCKRIKHVVRSTHNLQIKSGLKIPRTAKCRGQFEDVLHSATIYDRSPFSKECIIWLFSPNQRIKNEIKAG
jgi:hypothetical protein